MNTIIVFLDMIHRPVLFKHNISETGFCLRLQVEPTQLEIATHCIDGDHLSLKVPPEVGDRIQSPKSCV
jgi:hypothetical protein